MPMKASVISAVHREDDRADEAGGDDRGQVRQDLEDDDPPGRLAGRPGRLDVVAAAQRQRLRAQHPGAPRPRGEADHQRDRSRSPAFGKDDGDDDDQRQRRDHQEDVGQRGQAFVAGRRRGSRRSPRSTTDRMVATTPAGEADEHDAAGADQHLAEDVLAEVGGAEPVRRPTGGCTRSLLRALGSYGAIHGPMIANSDVDARMVRPVVALRVATKRNRLAAWPCVGGAASGCGQRALAGDDLVDARGWGWSSLSPPCGCAGRAAGRRCRPAGSPPAPTSVMTRKMPCISG